MHGHRIATLEDMARIARRHDTVMSRAMLRALGLPMPEPRSGRPVARRDHGAYDGIADCFENKRAVLL